MRSATSCTRRVRREARHAKQVTRTTRPPPLLTRAAAGAREAGCGRVARDPRHAAARRACAGRATRARRGCADAPRSCHRLHLFTPPQWDETALRIKASRLLGSQSLARYPGWKGDRAAVDAEQARNKALGAATGCWKSGVLVEDDFGQLTSGFTAPESGTDLPGLISQNWLFVGVFSFFVKSVATKIYEI